MRKETRTSVHINDEGYVQVQRRTYLVEDDGSVQPLGNVHLASYPPGATLPDDVPADVRQHAALAATPERIAIHQERVRAFLARHVRRQAPDEVADPPQMEGMVG